MKENSKFEEVKRNGKQYLLQLRKSSDSDIIEKLESQENKNGYLKTLIRKDLSGSDGVELLQNKITTTREKRLVLRYITELIKKDMQEEKEQDKMTNETMLALELYSDEKGYPDDFIVITEGSYDYDDYRKAILKSRDVYIGKRYESVCVVEMSKDAHEDFLKAKYGEDKDYSLYEWEEEHSEDITTLFASDCESIPEELYFRWWRADKDLDGAIFYYEHSTGNKIEDGYSIQIGKDLYGDYWFAVAEEDEDRIEDLQSFHNAKGRDIQKWQEWYKNEWILDVTKHEIKRLANYVNKGYKWII